SQHARRRVPAQRERPGAEVCAVVRVEVGDRGSCRGNADRAGTRGPGLSPRAPGSRRGPRIVGIGGATDQSARDPEQGNGAGNPKEYKADVHGYLLVSTPGVQAPAVERDVVQPQVVS